MRELKERLTEVDRVEFPEGRGRLSLAVIEAGKADGSWSKLDASHALDVPKDLADALAGDADAERDFGAFPPSARRAILQWIDAAKKPETPGRADRRDGAPREPRTCAPTSRTHAADAGTSRAFLPWTASMRHYQVRGR
jgi:Bacteriocin-protection, YdeI or OmpD-Associated